MKQSIEIGDIEVLYNKSQYSKGKSSFIGTLYLLSCIVLFAAGISVGLAFRNFLNDSFLSFCIFAVILIANVPLSLYMLKLFFGKHYDLYQFLDWAYSLKKAVIATSHNNIILMYMCAGDYDERAMQITKESLHRFFLSETKIEFILKDENRYKIIFDLTENGRMKVVVCHKDLPLPD